MTNVILHGALARRFGKIHRYNINKPVDAVRALMATQKGFRNILKRWGREGKLYEIICDGRVVETEEDLLHGRPIETVEIVPVVMGASRVLKIIVGVIMIIIGVVLTAYGYGALGKIFIRLGAALIIGGVMEILFPPPSADPGQFHTEAQGKSFLFANVQNTTNRGLPVQIGYGRLRVGSQIVSTELASTRLGNSSWSYGIRGGGAESDGSQTYENWIAMRQEQQRQGLFEVINVIQYKHWTEQFPEDGRIG
jgi:predicted phage tail protein